MQQGRGNRALALARLPEAVDPLRIGAGPEKDAVILPDQFGDAVACHDRHRRVGEDDGVVRLMRVGDDDADVGGLDHLGEQPRARGDVRERLPDATGFLRRRRGAEPLVGTRQGMGFVH